MNPLTREWVEKAEGDLTTASREWRARKAPHYDAACFRAQQCVGKYLKGLLQEGGIPFGKSHNLVVLLEAGVPRGRSLEWLRPGLEARTVFAVVFRYPGERAGKGAARRALAHCRTVRSKVREILGTEEGSP